MSIRKFIFILIIIIISLLIYKKNHSSKKKIIFSTNEEKINSDIKKTPQSIPNRLSPSIKSLDKSNNINPTNKNNDTIVKETPPNPYLNMPGNTLVSCQTKVKNCEPINPNISSDEADNGTFCITYLQNCDTIESVQRSWTEEEVFPKNNPEEPPPVDESSLEDAPVPPAHPPILDPNVQNPEYDPQANENNN